MRRRGLLRWFLEQVGGPKLAEQWGEKTVARAGFDGASVENRNQILAK